ncbi:MAG: peptide ABC transporter substrate-binding protein [Gammaproteobacteria bacterium]|nr:peptide ABC transporter substrate-binding protein [Gammaproteobacteria bacterium]
MLARSILSASDSLSLHEKHGYSTAGILYDLYSGLVALNSKGEIEPEIAQEWSVSNDGLSWTFKLREDALWSDSVPVTAWDFVYTYRNLPASHYRKTSLTSLYQLIKNGSALVQGLIADKNLLDVYAIDKYTLQINLEKPVADFLYHLTHIEAMPLPEHAYAMYGPDFGRDGEIINNGPYILGKSFKQTEFVLQKNPKYFGKTNIKFDKVRVIVEDDQNKLLKMFQAGKLDIVEGFDPRQKKWLKKYRPEIVFEMPANGLIFLIANTKSKKLEDIRVRTAMSYALDTKIIANRIYKSKDPGHCFLPEHLDNKECRQTQFSENAINSRIEKAKHLMIEAGFANKKLKVLLHVDDYPGNSYAATAIINMWKRINIDTVIVTQGVQSGSSDISLKNWVSDGNSPDHFIMDFFEMMSQKADHPELRSYIDQVTEHDLHKNLQLFNQLEEILAVQHYIVPVSSLQWRYLIRVDIAGFNKPVNGTYPSRWLERKKSKPIDDAEISPVVLENINQKRLKYSAVSGQDYQRH